MKKTKFMIGALVLSMGLLGTGYAYWTDTLAVSTTVDTGHLNVKFANHQSKDTYLNDIVHDVDGRYTTFVSTTSLLDGPAEGDYDNEEDLISIELSELVPGAYTCVKADMVNTGTVAARLAKVTPTLPTTIDEELKEDLLVKIVAWDNDVFCNLYEGTLSNLKEVNVKEVLGGRDILFVPGTGADSDIKLEVFVGLDSKAKNKTQNKNASIELKFLFEQVFDNNFWN